MLLRNPKSRGVAPTGGSFTPAWQSLRLGGGGALTGMHVYPDDTVITRGDTFGGWDYKRSGSATQDGTTYASPAWQLLFTTDSLPSGDVTPNNAYSGNTGAAEIVCAPSNTNIMYLWWNNNVYVSTNRGSSWTYTGFNSTHPSNGAGSPLNSNWIAVDPSNPDIVYLTTLSSGTYVNTSGTSGTTWTHIGAIASSDGNGGNVYFDFTSSHPGNVTQRILVSVNGTGVYETTNGGGSWANTSATNRPNNVTHLNGDKFGQIWASESFRGSQGVYKYSSGAWSFTSLSGADVTGIVFDPNTGSVQANNQVILVDSAGQFVCSLDNGGSWGAGGTPLGNITKSAGAGQPGWMGAANTYSSPFGQFQLSIGGAAIDSTGTIWAASGIDVFKTTNPIVAGVVANSVNWAVDTVGVDQLVVNQIISVNGLSPLVVVWDRGVFLCQNPDVFPSSQFPNASNIASPFSYNPIQGAWTIDSPASTPTTFVTPISSQGGGPTILGQSTDGGNTWSLVNQPSVGTGLGAMIAMNSTTNWVLMPGDFSPAYQQMYYTTNAGTSWTQSNFPGTPTFIGINIGHEANSRKIVADRVTAGKFYASDSNQNFYVSTDNGANFSLTGATSANVDQDVGRGILISVPGHAGHVLYSTQGFGGSHLWKSTDGCVTWATIPAGGPFVSPLFTIKSAGLGAPLPGGGGYPTIYVFGQMSGVYGLYQSTDAGVNWVASNIPGSEVTWPYRSMDAVQWLSGDMNVYGRVYLGFIGSGTCYIDVQDACPWVNFSNIKPFDNKTGTITLSAQHSGLVPVTSVSFFVDGSLIGTQSSGSGTPTIYSQSWNTGGVGHGAHTLRVDAVGTNGTGSFSIPITTS